MAYNAPYPDNAQHPYYANNNLDTSYDRDRDLPRLPSPSPSDNNSYYNPTNNNTYQSQPGAEMDPSLQKSPFTTTFDGHIYPATSYQRTPSNQSLSPMDSNTAYYGQGGGGRPMDSTNQFSDNMPLRDHPGGQTMGGAGLKGTRTNDTTDHVYDIENTNPKRRSPTGFGFGTSNRFRFGGEEKTAWVVWLLTIIQVIVFIIELVKCAQITGSAIQTAPFNYMIGPSQYVLINMGSRYAPCMRPIDAIRDQTEAGVAVDWFCPSARDLTSLTSESNKGEHCRLNELCGFGAESKVDKTLSDAVYAETSTPTPEQTAQLNDGPDQWFRFIVPMFLHVGIIHLLFNMLLQTTLGRDMEKSIGSIRFFLVYIASGIFGFVMGGNFAGVAVSSVGASGALFGVIALTLLDLLYTWGERTSPWMDLLWILLDIGISFVLGLLPGLDNFAHIGGFLMGLVLGICILHSPNSLRKGIGSYEPPYQGLSTSTSNPSENRSGTQQFAKNPVGFFKGRKPMWWVWWFLRAAALVAVLVVFIVLVKNFYAEPMHVCSWCKRLSCLPVKDWCDADQSLFLPRG